MADLVSNNPLMYNFFENHSNEPRKKNQNGLLVLTFLLNIYLKTYCSNLERMIFLLHL